jgi:cyclin-dependent kinase 10
MPRLTVQVKKKGTSNKSSTLYNRSNNNNSRKRPHAGATRRTKGDNGGEQDDQNDTKELASSSSSSSMMTATTFGICSSVSARYKKVNRLGEGTYGVVYEALDTNNNSNHQKPATTTVALKRCLPHNESSDGFPLTTLREIHTLRVCCQHPNVVNLLDIAVSSATRSENGGVFLVFERCRTDIANILDTHLDNLPPSPMPFHTPKPSSPFSEANVKTLMIQLLSALEFCHQHYLIHRDIKPSNLLYTSDGTLKLCDFGLSRHCSGTEPLTAKVVSLWYRAPELLFQKTTSTNSHYSFPVDLFAVGCVFAELLRGVPLLDGTTELDQMFRMVECLGDPPTRIYEFNRDRAYQDLKRQKLLAPPTKELWDQYDFLPTEGLSLLTRLLEYDPAERWTATQALQSSYFTTKPMPTSEIDMPRF